MLPPREQPARVSAATQTRPPVDTEAEVAAAEAALAAAKRRQQLGQAPQPTPFGQD